MADENKGKGSSGFFASLAGGMKKLAEAGKNKSEEVAKGDKAARAQAQAESGTAPSASKPTVPSSIKLKISPNDRKKESQRKWMMVAGVAVAVIMLMSFIASRNENAAAPQAPSDAIPMMPESALKENFQSHTQGSIQKLNETSGQQATQIKETNQALDDIRAKLTEQDRIIDQLNTQLATQGQRPPPVQSSSGATPPPPEPTPGNKMGADGTPPPVPGGEGTAKGQGQGDVAVAQVSDDPVVFSPEVSSATAASGSKKVGAHEAFERNPMAGYLSSGAFAPTVLLTGIEAGTATTSQSNPQPVLMRVERDAILPGYADYQIQACFVLGSATGSLSSERANVLLARISCIDANKHLVIDSAIKGYVVDSDGMFGLRGKLVEREGAVLGKALLAGFASGLSSALGQAQSTTTTSALRGAAFSGGSNAANQLANFYLKQAESIFPTIEVEPKRKAAIVITEGSALSWSDYGSLFVKKISPEGH